MLVVFVLLFAVLSLSVPYFFSWQNMIGLALSVSTVGIIACTMLFCLASGDFDISVEAIVAFAGVLAAVVINATGSVATGIAAALVAASLAGAFNGVVIAKLRINALITTLATLQIVRGLGFIVSNGTAVVSRRRRFSFSATASHRSTNPSGSPSYLLGIRISSQPDHFGRNTLPSAGTGKPPVSRASGWTASRYSSSPSRASWPGLRESYSPLA